MGLHMHVPQKTLDRFWAKVNKTNSCWEWNASKERKGYGEFRASCLGGRWLAHRLSWFFRHGEIPNGLWVLHQCDNPSCVNPSHLYLGTSDDNISDMVSRNRTAKGARHSQAKLIQSEVDEIRRLYSEGAARKALVMRYRVSRQTIDRIVTFKNWK